MKVQENTQLCDCENDASVSLKSEIIISQFIIEDPERANLFTSIYLYKSAYCLLRVVVEMLENYFSEIDFSKYFQLCIDNHCHPKRVCELSRKNLRKQNKSSANVVFFELIAHVICNALSVYDKGICEKLMQENFGNANAYFYQTRQKEMDKINGSLGKAHRTEEENKVRAELIRLYNTLDENKKSKHATTFYTDLYPPLLAFMKKEKLRKQEYDARTIEKWINEFRSEIKNSLGGRA